MLAPSGIPFIKLPGAVGILLSGVTAVYMALLDMFRDDITPNLIFVQYQEKREFKTGRIWTI